MVRFYRNGLEIHRVKKTGEIPTSSANLFIGRGEDSFGYYEGTLDEVSIFDRALTTDEIKRDARGPYHTTGDIWSVPIARDDDGEWDTLTVARIEPPGTSVSVSIIDPNTNIRLLAPKEERNQKISGMKNKRSIQLKVTLSSADGLVTPVLDSWGVDWSSDNAWRDSFIGDLKIESPVKADEHTVALWHFERTKNGKLEDSSGNGNHGTFVNFDPDEERRWCEGRFGYGLRFDGVKDHVEVKDPSFVLGGEFTAEAWICSSGWAGSPPYNDQQILAVGDYLFRIVGSDDGHPRPEFAISNGSTDLHVASSPEALAINVWYHVAGVYDGEYVRIYVNGIEKASTYASNTPGRDTGELTIGGEMGGSGFFSGVIDEVRISNVSRTPEEVRKSNNLGIAVRGGHVRLAENEIVVDSHTSALWDFNEGEGRVVTDSGVNDNFGIIAGANWVEGRSGKALKFDGKGDFVEVPDSPSLDITNNITIEAWVNPSKFPPGGFTVVSKGASEAYALSIGQAGHLHYVMNVNGRKDWTSINVIVSTDRWYHIAATYDGTTVEAFVNGGNVGSWGFTGVITPNDENLRIGHREGGGEYFNGTIDTVAIYSRVLSAREIYNRSHLCRRDAVIRSEVMDLPADNINLWSELRFNRKVPDSCYLNITVRDGVTDEVLVTDKKRTDRGDVDLTIFNALEHPSIYLHAHMQSSRIESPVLYDWMVNWEEVLPPSFYGPIDTVEVVEDTPEKAILNLVGYFKDPYDDVEQTRYGLESCSDTTNMTLELNDTYIDIIHLSENWTGEVKLIVNCTNCYDLSVPSNKFSIVVKKVDDAPVWKSPHPEIVMTEDINFTSNYTLDDYVSDVEGDELEFNFSSNDNLIIKLEHDNSFTIIPKKDYNGETAITVCVRECHNHTRSRNISIPVIIKPVNDPPYVELLSPASGTISGNIDQTFHWEAFDVDDDLRNLTFDIFLGKSDPPGLHTPGVLSKYFTIKGLDNGETYYWYVLPSDGTDMGECRNGIRKLMVSTSFTGDGVVYATFDIEKIDIIRGKSATVLLNIFNNGNEKVNVEIWHSGNFSGTVDITNNISLEPTSKKTVKVYISETYPIPPGSYPLEIKMKYPGGWYRGAMRLNIINATGDDPPRSNDAWSIFSTNSISLIVLVIFGVPLLTGIFIVIHAIRKRRRSTEKTGYPAVEDISSERDGNGPGNIPSRQYHNNFQYAAPRHASPAGFRKPRVPMPERTVYKYKDGTFIPHFKPRYEEQDGVDHSGTDFRIPHSPAETAPNFGPFKTDGTLKCKICYGYIKGGAEAYRCVCGMIFHPVCRIRVESCPTCGTIISKEDAGFSSVEVEPAVIPVDDRREDTVKRRTAPRIIDGRGDFDPSDIFLIYLDGLLIKSISFKSSIREETDEDIMSGMLTAITDFVRDSFKDEMGGLKSLEYGRMTIFLERGVTMYLVLVFRGRAPEDLRNRMRSTLILLWEKYKPRLKVWDGTRNGIEEIDKDILEHIELNHLKDRIEWAEDDDQPLKYTGEILTEEPPEWELPQVVTTADVSTPRGCRHLYNMLLAKKGSLIRIIPESTPEEINIIRRQIVMMYHPDRWQMDKEKATFFIQKVNVAWEVLSRV